jgi:hypothetical protein
MPITNARVDVGSQEVDVEHEPPIAKIYRKGPFSEGYDDRPRRANAAQSASPARHISGSPGQDAGKAPKLTTTDSKARGSI